MNLLPVWRRIKWRKFPNLTMAPMYTYLIFIIPDKTINQSNNIRPPSSLSPSFQERAPFKTNTIEQTCEQNIWSAVGRCQPGLLFLLNFCWNTVTPIHSFLCYLHLFSCDWVNMAHKVDKMHYLVLYEKVGQFLW